jgi:hypothetical protein
MDQLARILNLYCQLFFGVLFITTISGTHDWRGRRLNIIYELIPYCFSYTIWQVKVEEKDEIVERDECLLNN